MLVEEAIHVVATHDGGKSWRELPIPKGCYFSSYLAALANDEVWYFCTDQAGVGSQDKLLYFSRDGGAHWELVAGVGFWLDHPNVLNNLPMNAYIYAFVASSPDHIWTLYAGDIAGGTESTDGGRTWQGVPVDSMQGGVIFFLDAIHGWVGGYNHISLTTDGGATWEHYNIYPPHARCCG
jgi:photosystem II stability/assembly factor-like uncharacterized protein